MERTIHTEKISKIYNLRRPDEVRALTSVSMGVERGEVVVLKGPSGSGKTTLLSLIGCMGRPTEGRLVVNGKDVAKLPERFLTAIRRRTFGFIFQQLNLIRDVSVLDNVMLPLYPLPGGLSETQEQGRKILARLGIAEKMHLKVKKLSGGEQQRVAIARALVNDPEIIIADEPTAHLDRQLSADLLDILAGLNREGRTVVIATHDPFVFGHRFVTRTIEMRDGRLVEGTGL
jgi:putative ABC transport system ATP-binding protein